MSEESSSVVVVVVVVVLLLVLHPWPQRGSFTLHLGVKNSKISADYNKT